jgi:alpha-ketoglutarate-dependent taurine dioxygenase
MTTLQPPTLQTPFSTLIASKGEGPQDIPEAVFVDAYKTYGAILLRGYDVDLDSFRALTERYCVASVHNESSGREVIDGEHGIQSVDLGASAFPLHPELSREVWKPDVCFFWCLSPPSNGGETTVCDGVEIVRQLPPAVRGAFENRRLRYTMRAKPEQCEFWLGESTPSDDMLANPPAACPYKFERVRDVGLLRYFTRPALHKPMFTHERAFGNFLMFGRYLRGTNHFPTFENMEPVSDALLGEVKAVSDRLTAPIRWSAGDIVVLDNSRFMHGRTAIRDVAERRIATYFGFLRFAAPDPEEGPDPPWRKPGFRPPL